MAVVVRGPRGAGRRAGSPSHPHRGRRAGGSRRPWRGVGDCSSEFKGYGRRLGRHRQRLLPLLHTPGLRASFLGDWETALRGAGGGAGAAGEETRGCRSPARNHSLPLPFCLLLLLFFGFHSTWFSSLPLSRLGAVLPSSHKGAGVTQVTWHRVVFPPRLHHQGLGASDLCSLFRSRLLLGVGRRDGAAGLSQWSIWSPGTASPALRAPL